MSDFAPAPWSYETSGKPGGNGDLNLYVVDANKRKIAAIWGKRGEKEATASVVMVAPETLALLKIAVEDYASDHGRPVNPEHWTNKANELFKLTDPNR